MAGETFYRRNPRDEFGTTILARSKYASSTYKNFVSGKSGLVRNPAYVVLTGKSNFCTAGSDSTKTIKTTLPLDERNINEIYNKNSHKPYPNLQRVVVEYGGDNKLAQKLSGTIECFTKGDFVSVYNHFLLPGNEVSVRFGSAVAPSDKWNPSNSIELTDFKVAVFSFNATQQGTWICNFTAVSSATALSSTDLRTTLSTNLVFQMAGASDKETTHYVRGVLELIQSDAQKNGRFAIDQAKDGEIIDVFADYDPGKINMPEAAAMIIYEGKQFANVEKEKYVTVGGASGEREKNQIYMTLGYVVNRIFNDKILRSQEVCIGAKDKPQYKLCKFEFDTEYSLGQIDPNFGTSADPTSILLLGEAQFVGNYKNSAGDGKNFKDNLHGGKREKVIAVNNKGIVQLEKILIHESVIHTAMEKSTSKRKTNAEVQDVVDDTEEVINITDFFKAIADVVRECTGGAISLNLAESPADNGKYSKMNRYIVVDNNYGGKFKLRCYVFNPLDGDGNTRSCEISSNVGSEEYRVSMFVGNTKKGDPSALLRGCRKDLDSARNLAEQRAVGAIIELIEDPGAIGKSKFEATHIDALKNAMRTLNVNSREVRSKHIMRMPGMSITITIDGAWGILPGCAISSTQVVKDWQDNKLYFMVTQVTHTIENSDWSTTMTGIMTYYDDIKYIPV